MKNPTGTTTRAQKLNSACPTSHANSISTHGRKRARHGHSPLDSTNSASSSTGIPQSLDKQAATNEVHDSEDSSPSSTMSAEDQSDVGWIPHQPRKSTTQDSSGSQSLPPDNASEEEVISIALTYPITKRHELLPKVFDRQGRLPRRLNYLQHRIDAAREEQKRQAAANEQKVQPILEAPVGIPKGFNTPPVLQNVEEFIEQVAAEEPRISSQGEDAAVVLQNQLNDSNELIDPTLGGRPPESPLSPPSQAKNRCPKTRNFSIQSRKNPSSLKTYGQGRNQSLKVSTQKAQKHAGNGHSGRLLRSGLAAKPLGTFQPLPAIHSTSEQSNIERFRYCRPAELPPPSETPLSPLKEIERSPVPDNITVDSSQVSRQKLPQWLPPQTDLVLASPSPREQETATRLLHGRVQLVQKHLSQNPQLCEVCRQKGCSCNVTQQHLEILCSDMSCYKRWWGVDDLWKYCGIKLGDAQESKRRFNCWFCPQCSNKARVLLQYELTSSSSSSVARHSTTFIREGFRHSCGPDNTLWPEDGEIREPLQHLNGMMQQYTGNTTMARNKLSPINSQTGILDIPCIRDEILDQSAGVANHAIRVIRKLLDVPDGVLIKHKVKALMLEDTTCPIWIRGVISTLVSEFVFHSGSPFEDAKLWKKILADAGHSPDQAENLIHDHRIRVMKAYEKSPDDPEIPPEFLDRVTRARQAFVERLNITMLPLIGGGSDVQMRHQKMAKVASELNLKTAAYRGTFEEIKPQILESFNPERHAEENPGSDYPDLAGKPILVTTIMGVRFKHPEKGWRTCSHAKVKVWPENNTERDSPNRDPFPDMPGGSPVNQTNRRIVPQKRQIGELS